MKKPIAVHIYEILCSLESFVADLIDRMLCLDSVADYYTHEANRVLEENEDVIQRMRDEYLDSFGIYPYGNTPLKVQTTVYPPRS